MNFKDAQFAYDNMSEEDYFDEPEDEQDYEPEEADEDLNAECVW